MKIGLTRARWRSDRRLIALTVARFLIALAVYLYVGLRHAPAA